MANAYLVYGLHVAADRGIPGFAPVPGCDPPDLRIFLDNTPAWYDAVAGDATVVRQTESATLTILRLNRDWWALRYCDGTEFIIEPAGKEVWVRFREGACAEDAVTYLVGPVFAFLLRLRGIHGLHASVVDVGGAAVAITGPKGAGKSTTAAAFAKLGYGVLSDDLAPMEDCGDYFLTHAGYPRLNLWPESAEMLFGSLPRIVPLNGGSDWWDKRYLDLAAGGRRFRPGSLPLAAIFVLERRTSSPAAPRAERLNAQSALIQLVGHTYGAQLLDAQQRAAAFQICGRLARCTPVFRVIPHRDPNRIPQLCDVILRDVAAVAGSQVI